MVEFMKLLGKIMAAAAIGAAGQSGTEVILGGKTVEDLGITVISAAILTAAAYIVKQPTELKAQNAENSKELE